MRPVTVTANKRGAKERGPIIKGPASAETPKTLLNTPPSNGNKPMQKWLVLLSVVLIFAILSAASELFKLDAYTPGWSPEAAIETATPSVNLASELKESENETSEETDDPSDEIVSHAKKKYPTANIRATSSEKATETQQNAPKIETPSSDETDDDAISLRQSNEETEDEDFEIPFDIRPIARNGCPFGWHSPTKAHPTCYHVSLVALTADEANGKCSEMGSIHGMRAYLAQVPSSEVNVMLCDVLNRGNNRFLSPDRVHIGLWDAQGGTDGSGHTMMWRDGSSFDPSTQFAPFFSGTPHKSLHGRTITLLCSGKHYLKWTVETDSAFPFACAGPKLPLFGVDPQEDRRELDEDSFTYEQSDTESATWTPVAPWEKTTIESCSVVAQEEDEFGSMRRAHKNAMLARLDVQINWKLTEKRSRLEPKRHYMVWQSKAWYGWLDFWVEYLTKYRDFHGAPVGKFVTSSRAAKERLGYSSIFGNPALAQKYEGALVVLSRLPIPDNVVAYFPPGTLVNQIYMDPLARVPLGDKLELAQHLIRYSKRMGCKEVGDLAIIPATYDASSVSGCKRAIAALEAVQDKSEVLWVVKGPKHGGSAITLATSDEVLARLKPCDDYVLQKHELVQKLVTNPLLLDGKKFDLRVFVLVTSTQPLIAYVHREPYYRATIKRFGAGGAAGEKSRHVTNTHIQKVTRANFTDKDWADHLWTPERVRLYAHKAGVRADFWHGVVFPKIKRAVQNVFRATSMSITDRRPGQWKLFGVDFVIDDKLDPYLLDWNAFPGWDWSYRLTWTLEYRRRILGDAWRLLLDVQRGKAISETRPTPKSSGFELIYHTIK